MTWRAGGCQDRQGTRLRARFLLGGEVTREVIGQDTLQIFDIAMKNDYLTRYPN
jgi:hypothetical protein